MKVLRSTNRSSTNHGARRSNPLLASFWCFDSSSVVNKQLPSHQTWKWTEGFPKRKVVFHPPLSASMLVWSVGCWFWAIHESTDINPEDSEDLCDTGCFQAAASPLGRTRNGVRQRTAHVWVVIGSLLHLSFNGNQADHPDFASILKVSDASCGPGAAKRTRGYVDLPDPNLFNLGLCLHFQSWPQKMNLWTT